MDISVIESSPSYQLHRAVLLYGSSSSNLGLVTLHDVEQTKSGPIIKEGVPATQSGLFALFDALSGEIRRPLQLLHPNVLAMNDDTMVWWEAARSRRVVFDCKELGKRAATVPQPALLFAVTPHGWNVFALPSNERPTAQTMLCVSPYFNVWKEGRICVGSTSVPRGKKLWDPDAWSEAFFASAFTHPNIHEKNQLVRYEFGPFAFWRDMLDGKFDAFPDVLVTTKQSLGQFINQLTQGGKHA